MPVSQNIKSAMSAAGDAPVFGCRAWVNFNGTGTPAINLAGNVSSVTDNGLGDYTVNFNKSMPHAFYAVAGAVTRETNAAGSIHVPNAFSNASYRFTCRDVANVARDGGVNSIAIFC